MKKDVSEDGEALDRITIGEKIKRLRDKKSFIKREGISNGNVRIGVKDGAGKTHFKRVFSGNINQQQQGVREFSNNHEFSPRAEWSNGSDTREIEAKLRATKRKLGYIEVEGHRHGGKRKGAGRKKGK